MSATYDEPYHLACGIGYHQGLQLNDEQHPPLARYLAAWRLYSQGVRLPDPYRWDIDEAAVISATGDPVGALRFARATMLVFLAIGIISVFGWANCLFGKTAGYVSALFYCLLPPILAHSALVTTDHPATAMLCFASWMLTRYAQDPSSLRKAGIAGMAVGLSIATKLSVLAFLAPSVGLFCVVLVAEAIRLRRWRARELQGFVRSYGKGWIIAMLALFVAIAGGYGFQVVSMAESRVIMSNLHELKGKPFEGAFLALTNLSLPGGRFVWSVVHLVHHASRGHGSYLLGEFRSFGWWYFFPIVLLMKVPIPFLLMSFFGFFLNISIFIRERSLPVIIPTCLVVGILTTCVLSTINLGVRHILPILPAMCVLGGAACSVILSYTRRTLWAGLIGVTLFVWLLVNSVSAHPRYLSWFTEAAPSDPSLVLIDSDLDWGQDLISLADHLREHGISEVGLDYFGVDLLENYYDGTVMRPPAKDRYSGWLAVSITRFRRHPNDYSWLEGRQWRLIGASIRLYQPVPSPE